MSDQMTARPAICLNMIVKNEAHIVGEVLDAVAPYISSWVIVDTGSDDGTQNLIRDHMASLDIPGELHDRPWRDFGHNRSEALTLAQGQGDYIWVMDADDTIMGTPDFTRLTADVYFMRVGETAVGMSCWRAQLFRDGVPVRYQGVVHEAAVWDESCVTERLEGEYLIESRRLGARNLDPQKFERDRDLLLAEVERNPEDARSVIHLAQAYFDLGDFDNARKWYARRAEMGGWDEEVYHAMYQAAQSMAKIDAPWPDIQEILLQAWDFRPTRAEPLYVIAQQHRANQRYRLGYVFAKLAAEIPFPEQDTLFVPPDVYWRTSEEQAICASSIGRHAEAFMLCRRLVARPDVPDAERQRIAGNRDVLAPAMITAASEYPEALVQRLTAVARADADVVVSLVAGSDRASAEQMLNSFLNCCFDVSRVARFLLVDAGLSAEDRAIMSERYGFLEFADREPSEEVSEPGAQLAHLRAQIDARFWLHLGRDWRFFAPDVLITRLMAVLDAEPQVFQVAVNFGDAVKLAGACAAEQVVRRAPDAGRYVVAGVVASGPAMFDTARLDRAGGVQGTDADSLAELGQRAAAAELRTATLDEVLCVAAVDQVQQPA